MILKPVNHCLQLRIDHVTLFEYDSPVYETSTEVRLQPCANPGAPQRLLQFSIQVEPATTVFDYQDYFGNTVHHFNLLQSLERLKITATSMVETGPGWSPASVDDEVRSHDFLAESRFIQFDPAVRDFAFSCGDSGDPLLLAERICTRIHDSFVYERGVTGVHSTSAEVMALGRGVCQDFAHVMIAACRSRGIPSRYVSGYIYGGRESEDEPRASHAWCEVLCGREHGWIAFDPTRSHAYVDERYVKIGSGRDYGDVTPVRGTYKGNAKENLTVSVMIRSVAPPSQPNGAASV